MDASPPPTIPRLRISRFSPQSNNQVLTPVAGPSHNPDYLHADDDDEEDAESTPRMSASAIPDKQSPRTVGTPGLPADTPAARLRALLARVPNTQDSATPHASSSRRPAIPSSSEPDSDLEPPYSMVTASSIARESLKELFSRALREPGNTPRKGKQRRNSIDASEVEASPRVEEERAKYKGKRRSLSDEEAEKSKHIEPSERSFRSSSAASAFDALRQRLDGSASTMPTLPPEQLVMDMSMPPPNSSTDTAMPPAAPIDTSSETPPYATSTPMRTFQMSAHLHMQSNLLDQDSEMQNALQGMDSYETAPAPKHRHSTPSLKGSAGPSPRPQPQGPSPARPVSWSSHSKSHSIHNLPLVRRGSEDLDNSSSRASSSQSGADHKERQDEVVRERLHDRERGWNSPLPKSPAHPSKHDPSHRHSWGSPGNGHASPSHRLARKGSAASLASTDDGRSSRASSVASRRDHDERTKFLDEERAKEREREWNKPHPKLSRSSSSLSLNKSERLRTHSTPTRPDSAASYLSPNRLMLHRHASSNSLSSSSRPSSPASSISGHSVEVEIEHEIEHQRERNWNSPHPHWGNPLHHRRSLSPLPRSPAGSPTHSAARHATTTPRSRHNSTTQAPGISTSSKSVSTDKISRPKSPLLRSTVDNKPSPHPRPESPVAGPSLDKAESSSLAGYKSHFGWSFPQKRTPLPPLELDQDSPRKPLSRPSSRSSLSATPSHIPVRSPRKEASSSTSQSEKKRTHRRSITEFAESVGAIPPRIAVTSDASDELPPVPIVNGHGRDDFSSAKMNLSASPARLQ
ncbi:hypothetical protein OH77DRAFT_259691 [Trametes cingulata]|nr:hypothetical protein OH77DRAFT_259691 [Trametes cingulata]